jgi:hypothetical protein
MRERPVYPKNLYLTARPTSTTTTAATSPPGRST